jgi:hypothetical protein
MGAVPPAAGTAVLRPSAPHDRRRRNRTAVVTSLARFILILGVAGGLIYGGLVALTLLVEPEQREITVQVPPGKIGK